MISNVAGILPNFNPEDVDNPEFNNWIQSTDINIRKQIAEKSKQLEQSERLLNEQRQIDELTIKQAETEGRLKVNVSPKEPEFYAKVQEASKRKLEIEQETEHFNKLNEKLSTGNEGKLEAIDKYYNTAFEYLNNHPGVRVRAEQIANKRKKGNHGVITPDIIKQAINEETAAATQGIEQFNHTPEAIQRYEELQNTMNLGDTIEQLQMENAELQQQLSDSQERRRQAGSLILHMKDTLENHSSSIQNYAPLWQEEQINNVVEQARFDAILPPPEDEDILP